MSTDDGKADKAAVDYRGGTSLKRCGTCKYSYGPADARRCKLVKGIIKPDDVCDLWEKK